MTRGTLGRSLGVLLWLGALAPRAFAQAPADSVGAATDSVGSAVAPDSATRAAVDSVAAARAAEFVRVRRMRASWLTDRLPLEPGDLLTVIVDEQTAARERVSTIASAKRSQKADLNAGVSADARLGPWKSFGTGLANDTRDVGEAGRMGGLTAVLTVRVLEVSANGVAKVSGTKKVTVDGRTQAVTLTGYVRSEDVDMRHRVPSDAIADAVIDYRGKKIGPRAGILGNILSILWP